MSGPIRLWVAVKHGVDVVLARADRSTGTVAMDRAPRKTSDFDRNAVEEAVRIREKLGGTVTALTVGPPTSKEALRDALALGADEAVLITDPARPDLDGRGVARALAAYARTHPGFDLWFFGEGSTDHFTGTIGPRVAAEIGAPSLSYARRVSVEDGAVLVEREYEHELEKVRAAFPAIITVGQEINQPRVPTFMSTLKASKKEIRSFGPSELGVQPSDWAPLARRDRVFVPEVNRKRQAVSGADPATTARGLVDALRREGVLP